MKSEPTREHRWLETFVGSWEFESECSMGPDQPPSTFQGVEVVRSLGGLWVIGEGTGPMPEGGEMNSVITLGFDSRSGRFVGSFVASVMDFFWTYNGSLDDAGTILTLDAEGPAFSGEGLAKYQDSFELVSPDHRILRSQFLTEDGTWVPFMTAHYRRTAGSAIATPHERLTA